MVYYRAYAKAYSPVKKYFGAIKRTKLESTGQILKPGKNFSLSKTPCSKQEALHFFNGLSPGGKVEAPFKKEFWGAYFGMFLDKFDIRWMINYDPNAK